MRIRGLALLLLVLPTVALAAPPTVQTPQPVGHVTAVAPSLARADALRGTVFRDGHLIGWIEEGEKLLRLVRLDAARKIVGTTSIQLDSVSTGEDSVLIASDGSEALVAIRQYPYNSYTRHVVAHVSATLGVTLHTIRDGHLRALAWNGTAYVALVEQSNALSAVEMDSRGIATKEVALSLPPMQVHSYYATRWSRLWYADQGTVWLVGKNGTEVWRAALTDETGHVAATPRVETLPFTLNAQHRLIDAGPTPFGSFLLYDGSPSETLLQFVDRNGSKDGEPILVMKTHGSSLLGQWTIGGVLIFGSWYNVLRVGRGGCGAEPGRSCLEAQPLSNILEGLGGVQDVLETRRGVLALGLKGFTFDERGWSVPTATFVSIGTPAKPVRASEPVVLSWDVPDARSLAATPHADGFLVVWHRQSLSGSEIWGQRFDSLGGAPSAPHFIAKGRVPMVASQGDIALVVWSRNNAIEAIRVDRSGVPIDSAPIAIEPGALKHVGFDGVQFNVLYTHSTSNNTQIRAAILTPHHPAGAAPQISRIYENNPFSWDTIDAVTAPGVTLLGGMIYPFRSAVVLAHDLSPKTTPHRLSSLSGPTIPVWDGNQFLVTWLHQDHVRFARMSTAGQALDSEFGQAIGNFPPDNRQFLQGFYRAVADGDRLFVATPGAITAMRPLRASETTRLSVDPAKCSIAALARRPDGTMLVVYTLLDRRLDNYYNSIRGFAAVVMP